LPPNFHLFPLAGYIAPPSRLCQTKIHGIEVFIYTKESTFRSRWEQVGGTPPNINGLQGNFTPETFLLASRRTSVLMRSHRDGDA
jgi:hypothetical protein